MPKPKRVDPIKQREKRAKIAAAIGGALFLVVAAVEVPPVLKSNSPPPAAASPATTTTAAPTDTTGSTSASTSAPAAGELPNTDTPPPTEPGDLVSFNVFQAKNPFAPQVTSSTDTSAPTTTTPAAPTNAEKQGADVPPASTTTTTTPATTTPTSTTPTVTPGTSVVPSSSSGQTTTAAPAPTGAITVNGSVSHVGAGDTFPVASPVFRLVSFGSGTAQIGIVGGSYAAGGATLTLHLHTPVTLENQTDGKRYTLELDSVP